MLAILRLEPASRNEDCGNKGDETNNKKEEDIVAVPNIHPCSHVGGRTPFVLLFAW